MIKISIRHLEKLEYRVQETMNSLCANLSFIGGDIRKILITSCYPQEGKSFVSIHLMQSMAATGLKVILVDADIRASALEHTYGIEVITDLGKYQGLSGYLSGLCGIDAVIGNTNMPGADMILSGPKVKNSFPLFNSPRLKALLDELASRYDVVLIDTPPIGTIIDAAKIAVQCNGALFIVESGRVTVNELKNAAAQIEKTGCPIIGYVLNKAIDNHYNKKYYSYYLSDGQKDKSKDAASS